MFLINKTDKYEVIELIIIEYGVYLIPDFDPIGAMSTWI